MKKMISYLSVALLGLTTVATAQVPNATVTRDTTVCGVQVENASLKRNADLMTVNLELELADLELTHDRVAVFAPAIVNGSDSLQLAPVGVYGRTRWYQYLRAGEQPLGGEAETSYRYSERPDTYTYNTSVPYAEWMNGARISLLRGNYSCCRELVDEEYALLGSAYRETVFAPKSLYMTPTQVDAAKVRTLSGRAFVDFPVNLTVIYPDYRNNTRELSKIIATIDSVRNDSDVTVQSITIKGFASPEGPYTNNIRLAKGRTAALKQYVQNLYMFSEGFIATDYEPEDWEGLREYVASSSLAHRDEILAIIDSNLEPDPKNAKIEKTYPEEYQFLLKTVYPGLRHSDYTIEYTIRNYSDPAEIAEVLRTAPQKLSLSEMYLLSQTLEPGSEAYNEVFETAVRMFPNDETANLNAANAAMDRNDLKSAEKYLQKAGTSAQAEYTRGKLAGLQGDYEAAEKYFESAAASMPEAAEVIEQLRSFLN